MVVTGRGRGPRALSAAAAGVTRVACRRRGFAGGAAGGAIVTDWPAIVGEILALHTAPERLSFSGREPRDGTLRLRIDHGGLAVELQHLAPLLIERVNAYFGYRAVARLELIQAPVPAPARRPAPAPVDPAIEARLLRELDSVDDPELKTALEGLARAMSRPHRRKPAGRN